MKNTLKIITLLLFMVTVSCSKDDDNTTPAVEKKLKSITSSQGVTTNTTTFNYDNSGKWVSGVNRFNQNYSVSYNNNDKIRTFEVENQPSSTIEYQYSISGGYFDGILEDTYETDVHYTNMKISELSFYSGSLLNNLYISYDTNGRIATITNNDELTRFSYTYDTADRITRVDRLSSGNIIGPYVLSSYTIYEYESHKNPTYQFFKQQMDLGQLIFSPFDVYPSRSRIFSYTDFNKIYILPEYNIKTVKEYSVNNTTQPIYDVTMNYTLENNKVMSFTTTTIYNNTTTSETTNYTYEN